MDKSNIRTIDLHMHTTVSDGTDTPGEILSRVRASGIGLFAVTDHDAVKGCEVGHHGNNGNRTSAKIYIAHGCIWAIQCNHESGRAGKCDFTYYGSGRMAEQGVQPWQLEADVHGVIKAGKATFTQGGKSVSWTVPFCASLYRVRKTWADASSQAGAYSIYENARIRADALGAAYGVFDSAGKEVYRPGKTATADSTGSQAAGNEKPAEKKAIRFQAS